MHFSKYSAIFSFLAQYIVVFFKILLLTAECHTLCLLTVTCMAPPDTDLVGSTTAVLIVFTAAGLTVNLNVTIWLHCRISSSFPFSLPETFTAGSIGSGSAFAVNLDISLAAVPVVVVKTICGRTY